MYAFKTHDKKVVFCSEQPVVDECFDDKCKYGRHWSARGAKEQVDQETGDDLIGFALEKEECIRINIGPHIGSVDRIGKIERRG